MLTTLGRLSLENVNVIGCLLLTDPFDVLLSLLANLAENYVHLIIFCDKDSYIIHYLIFIFFHFLAR